MGRSFAAMHNDHLDPDLHNPDNAPYCEDCEIAGERIEALEKLVAELVPYLPTVTYKGDLEKAPEEVDVDKVAQGKADELKARARELVPSLMRSAGAQESEAG